MKGIITRKGAKRLRLINGKNKIVEVVSTRTMPWGAVMATFILPGLGKQAQMHAYAPGHGKDCCIILYPG